MSNSGYANLLAHLHNPSTPLPLPTIQSALAHHLAKLSPLPTPLAASIVSSPLFSQHPFTHPKLQALFTAFRHATHLKYRDAKDVEKEQSAVGAVFSRGTVARVKQWAGAVLKGIKGGQPILRLATAERLEIGRSQLEDEVIISVAESMDVYAISSEWEAEFQPVGDVDAMTLALILASQSLVLVVPSKLKALPLPVLTNLLVLTIASTFASGTFLSTVSATLRAINESPVMEFIAPISKLTALTLTILVESRPAEGIAAAAAALDALRPISKTLESDWIGSSLARNDDAELAWKTLKTLLFANIMIADAALSALVFVSPAAYTGVGPSALALTLKKTFYLALDVLAKSAEESDRFVRELVLELRAWQTRAGDQDPDVQAKTAYALTSIEQLVPVLSGECIQSCALPLALPFLSDPSYRETYESSHSVVLAVFASHADRHASETDPAPDARAQAGPRFTERMVPFYARCLIENSVDGRLNTPQLRLAFAALVRSACASARSGELTDDGYALAWYCVDALLGAIHTLSDPEGAVSANDAPPAPAASHPHFRRARRLGRLLRGAGKQNRGAAAGRPRSSLMRCLKELAMRWWYDNRLAFSYSEPGTVTHPRAESDSPELARL
ncbi:hypothetical protein B0H16DRAFT_1624977 [Mycena metata]|uniref:Uncharacterized protein n=1 Tax=Mycena metata TaxID=1033252 RepID=A0AAD7H4X1_9AGAR|nr:hypothetical protein B0H16DRAFT_1624977 [Mycena metata]